MSEYIQSKFLTIKVILNTFDRLDACLYLEKEILVQSDTGKEIGKKKFSKKIVRLLVKIYA